MKISARINYSSAWYKKKKTRTHQHRTMVQARVFRRKIHYPKDLRPTQPRASKSGDKTNSSREEKIEKIAARVTPLGTRKNRVHSADPRQDQIPRRADGGGRILNDCSGGRPQFRALAICRGSYKARVTPGMYLVPASAV